MNWWKENKLQRRLYVCIALLFAAVFAYYAIARADTLAGLFAAALSCLLFALCTLVSVAAFSLIYAACYGLTARTYYRIVGSDD